MPDTQTAMVSAGVSAVISLTVSWLTRRSNERTAIDGKLLKSIEMAMNYPHVEDERYCATWVKLDPKAPAPVTEEEKELHEKHLQYDMYCCFIFNLLESIHRHCWFEKNIDKIVHAEEIIEAHRPWWAAQNKNITGYSKGFRAYVYRVLDQIDGRKS